jgi:hypothetical protein
MHRPSVVNADTGAYAELTERSEGTIVKIEE